jgi:microcystin-dependent protein
VDPFVAEIRVVGFNFAPKGWAQCNGQLLPISQNTALFSLLGTFYGGDGKSTFALPNLQGNTALHQGQGQGLSERFIGEQGGSEFVTLLESEMPFHNHNLNANALAGSASLAAPTQGLARSAGGLAFKQTPFGATNNLAFQAIAPTGGSLPHNNMMPYLTLNFVIALQGVFPPRG